jgi:glucan 1,3-beta-glucosidase
VGETPPGKRLRGVNLGGWLVLEKWMSPSLFAGLTATDETSWCLELGRDAGLRLRGHWDSWIRREDFLWIAERGLDAVRIPVGHWLFGPPYPWHRSYGDSRTPFVEGGHEVLERALRWASEAGLRVMVDLHAAPGCQNGFDNGGIKDVCEWHTSEEYVDFSVQFLGELARRYRSEPALQAIEVLNEPRWDVPTAFLEDYYRRAYAAIRAEAPAERLAVVFHDGFRHHGEFVPLFRSADFRNVLFDVHRYQCFAREDIDMDIHGHLRKAGDEWKDEAIALQQALGVPAICGEWSLGLDLKLVSLWVPGPWNHALEGMDAFQQDVASRAYAAAQLLAFERYTGWFFWSYRTETTPSWCLRESVERGWLPHRFQ